MLLYELRRRFAGALSGADSIFHMTLSAGITPDLLYDKTQEAGICGTNSLCLSEYRATGVPHIARSAVQHESWVHQLQSFSKPGINNE